MKKVALGLALAMALMGCRAQVRVQAKAEAPPPEPPKQEEAAKEPEPAQGEQIVLPDQIEFEFNQARIKQTPKTLDTLQQLATLMKDHPKITKLRIEGHTDNVGTSKHNERLSKARADAVAKWLAQHDVDESRLTTIGYGASRPLKPNTSALNRAQNRRTDYFVDQVDGKSVQDGEGEKVASGTTSGGKTAN